MLGQVRFISRQKCFIRVRRLLCSKDTSKATSENTFSNVRLLSAANFASAAVIFGSGITFAIAYYPSFMSFLNTPVSMEMTEGDVTRKLCEKISSMTEFNNVGDGLNYVTRPSLEKSILQASEAKFGR